MTKMYIANCTQQVQDFQYRLPENQKLLKQTIAIGGQIQIPGDLTRFDIDAIIEQHARYGLVGVSEIDRTRDFIGICYQLDKPVNVDFIRRALGHNMGVLDARGRVIRQEAAVMVSNAIEEQSPAIQALETMVVEQVKNGKDIEVNETVRVTRKEDPAPRTSGRGASTRRRAA